MHKKPILLIDDKESFVIITGSKFMDDVGYHYSNYLDFVQNIVDFKESSPDNLKLIDHSSYKLVLFHESLVHSDLTYEQVISYKKSIPVDKLVAFTGDGTISLDGMITSREHLFNVLEDVIVFYKKTGWLNKEIFFEVNNTIQRPLIDYLADLLLESKDMFLSAGELAKWLEIQNYEDINYVINKLSNLDLNELIELVDEWKYAEVVWKR